MGMQSLSINDRNLSSYQYFPLCPSNIGKVNALFAQMTLSLIFLVKN